MASKNTNATADRATGEFQAMRGKFLPSSFGRDSGDEVKARPRQVPNEIGKLAEAVSILAENVAKLHDTVRPAAYPLPESAVAELKAAAPEEPLCEVASLIRDQRYKVLSLVESILFLIDSVQV